MIHLGPTASLEVVTGSAVNAAVVSYSYTDLNTSSGVVTPGFPTNQSITGAGTNTIVGAPGANVVRRVHNVAIRNSHATSSNVISVQHDDGSAQVELVKLSLGPGCSLHYESGEGWYSLDASGRLAQYTADSALQSAMLASLQIIDLYKAFGTAKAGGSPQSGWLANPNPGSAPPAYTAGSGYACSRSTPGALQITNAVNKNRLAFAVASLSTLGTVSLFDRLWSCSGMGFAAGTYTVTTPGSLPARVTDNGAGCEVWLEQFVAAGVASGTATLNYVNAAGSNVSAVIPAVASAPVAGQMQRFPVQDGIRSVTSVVTSATWTSGSFGVTILRRLLDIPVTVANIATYADWTRALLREIPPDVCGMLALMPSTTTATTCTGTAGVVDMS